MRPAIRVENLSKRYRLGAKPAGRYITLRESITDTIAAAFRRRRSNSDTDGQEFWALKDVNLEIRPGEVVGLIGRNGAGKSTLLKVLSRVTEPTRGRVELRGRVGSLLEVGTGFHFELTGRENIFLCGSILGMSRREIIRRFDEIVAFAEMEKFLDTPVKRYSSGMYVRLAFSVAAHLEPEVMIIDEVLAVGDAGFQRKCIGKTLEVARGGRTILLVSHQMDVVRRLCGKAVLLRQGEVAAAGAAEDVINQYLAEGAGRIVPGVPVETLRINPRGGNLEAVFTHLTVREQPHADGPLTIDVRIEARRPVRFNSLCINLYDASRTRLVSADTIVHGDVPRPLTPGTHEFAVRIPRLHLRPGVYGLGVCLAQRPVTTLDHCETVGDIEVLPTPGREDEPRPFFDGSVACEIEWIN
jgi:lipopolysaccharide transport system ATP-binding protein